MRQYMEVKERYPDCIVFFRLGDFYEMFFDDAIFAAQALDLTLTSRDKSKENPIPMCGVPHHAAKQYIGRLVELGKKVALCEQVEDPKLAKKIVRRAVIQVITPGVVLEEDQLSAKIGHYLAAVCAGIKKDEGTVGIAYLDVSTGEFAATQTAASIAVEELGRIQPKEILYVGSDTSTVVSEPSTGKSLKSQLQERFRVPLGQSASFSPQEDREFLREAVQTFGGSKHDWIEKLSPALLAAAAACVRYAKATQLGGVLPLTELRVYQSEDELLIDESTTRHLELFHTSLERTFQGSLLSVIDRTKTALGGRLLRTWLRAPSQNLATIERRLRGVEWLFLRHQVRDQLQRELAQVYDIERLTGRLTLEVATPKDVARLGQALSVLPSLRNILELAPKDLVDTNNHVPELLQLGTDLGADIKEEIFSTLVDEPPITTKEGGIIRRGYHKELDVLSELASGGRQQILAIEERERIRTGIPSLKVNYNRVFGYYIEITRTHLSKVPPDYIRKQTMAQAERFITPELSDYEAKVLSADEERLALEQKLFEELRKRLIPKAKRLLALAAKVANMDALCSLAEVAHRFGYVRPQVNQGLRLEIEEGRHPVLEQLLPSATFIANDIVLDPKKEQICLITGPNMAGKSTIMRQTALICILAQMGSFVPAKRAKIGLLDRVFTRVGASDNLSAGESTFMVEMRETAQILKSATKRSLVILDEIGRGTSTYDGISIAWAVTEYLHDTVFAKTLFATHYHELCSLSETHKRVFNTSVAVRQYQGEVVFLHKLIPGGASRSYGIEVAKLAGLPNAVIERARFVLHGLETGESGPSLPHHGSLISQAPQLALFGSQREKGQPTQEQDSWQREGAMPPSLVQTSPSSAPTDLGVSESEQEILHTLRTLAVEDLTPRQAMVLILEISRQLQRSET